jgi:hypothetical protein
MRRAIRCLIRLLNLRAGLGIGAFPVSRTVNRTHHQKAQTNKSERRRNHARDHGHLNRGRQILWTDLPLRHGEYTKGPNHRDYGHATANEKTSKKRTLPAFIILAGVIIPVLRVAVGLMGSSQGSAPDRQRRFRATSPMLVGQRIPLREVRDNGGSLPPWV